MQDYKTMYLNLYNKITDAIDILQQAQQEAEERYVNYSNTMLHLRCEKNINPHENS